jgi:C-terminal processing protease CtpA/Prc
MEGVGVEPDITVVNNPADEFAGKDDQLTRAIEEIRKLMTAQSVRIPAPPESPDKKR